MKSVFISGVFRLLFLVHLEAATSVPKLPCINRNLHLTVDLHLNLSIDGITIAGLPNADTWDKPDVVFLPCTARLIAIHGRSEPGWGKAAILASTDDDYILTNSLWKCSNISHTGWNEIDFDDSDWMYAVEYGRNGDFLKNFIPGVSSYASWIWLRQDPPQAKVIDAEVYCRMRLLSSADNNLAVNNMTCLTILSVLFGVSLVANIAVISALWILRLRKKTPVYEVLVNSDGDSATYGTVRSDQQNVIQAIDQSVGSIRPCPTAPAGQENAPQHN